MRISQIIGDVLEDDESLEVIQHDGTEWVRRTLAAAGIAAAPASSTDEALARYNGTAGALQNSGVTLDDSNNMLFPSAALLKFIDANAKISSSTSGTLDLYATILRLNQANKGDVLLGSNGFLLYPETPGGTQIGDSGAEYGPLFILQTTLGSVIYSLSSTATGSDPTELLYQNRVATTDATVTTLHSFTIPASTTLMITAHVVARRTGGAAGTAEDGAGYVIRGTYKNVAGTATLIGAVSADYTAESVAGYDATLDVSGGTARLRVTGVASTNITWHMTARVWYIST